MGTLTQSNRQKHTMLKSVLVAALVAVAVAAPIPLKINNGKIDMMELFSQNEPFTENFDWKDCGSASAAAHVTSLSISPSPIDISKTQPANVTFSIDAHLDSTITAAKAELTVRRRFLACGPS